MLDDGIRPELIVILSDINMPGMDGLTLLGEIKRRGRAAGDDGDGLWRRRTPPRGERTGAAKFVTKPVDFDLLKQQLLQLPDASDRRAVRDRSGQDPRRR